MGMQSREDILGAKDGDVQTIPVAGWGDVNIRVISGKQRNAFEKACVSAKDDGAGIREMLVAMSLCDVNGKQLFQDDEGPLLADKSSVALDEVFTAAVAHNRLGKDADAGN